MNITTTFRHRLCVIVLSLFVFSNLESETNNKKPIRNKKLQGLLTETSESNAQQTSYALDSVSSLPENKDSILHQMDTLDAQTIPAQEKEIKEPVQTKASIPQKAKEQSLKP